MCNRGSSVVEMSIVMPIILGVLVLVLTLFLDTVEDSLTCRDGYSLLYTYDKDVLGNIRETNQGLQQYDYQNNNEAGFVTFSQNKYCYTKNDHSFIRETGVCSSRLRRWQFYGDVIFE